MGVLHPCAVLTKTIPRMKRVAIQPLSLQVCMLKPCEEAVKEGGRVWVGGVTPVRNGGCVAGGSVSTPRRRRRPWSRRQRRAPGRRTRRSACQPARRTQRTRRDVPDMARSIIDVARWAEMCRDMPRYGEVRVRCGWHRELHDAEGEDEDDGAHEGEEGQHVDHDLRDHRDEEPCAEMWGDVWRYGQV